MRKLLTSCRSWAPAPVFGTSSSYLCRREMITLLVWNTG
ncbi:MAG: hypothetical protein AVDCRST_MAG88-2357 [uncultured Thermomicrobiales bacterium]|uniref:Uncharacterized protein n=1 Tax=uncultured Thermomicrobiales bacterium TaxID=1645740 RepID=A0A6J4V8M2_9BACT|nr:MAG: hypothetical protein AVDCRST_MAG88-2357 [uncultured Thermomicrobiales bacterium]